MQKIKFSNKPFCNDWHFFLFAAVLLLISFEHPFFYFFLILYLIFIVKKTKYFLYVFLVLASICISYLIRTYQLKPLEEEISEDIYEVIDLHHNGVILKGKTRILINHPEEDLLPGDVIYAKIRIYDLEEGSYTGDFNEKKFYASKLISNKGRILSYEKVNQKWTISRIKTIVINFYEKNLEQKSFQYIKALVFGINDFDQEMKQTYSLLYLSHILSISGLHMQFLFFGLVKLFRKIFKINGEALALTLLGIYGVFIGFPVACFRAFLFIFLQQLNRKGDIQYTKLDIYSMSFLFIVLINPYMGYHTGVIFSFIISFVLLFMSEFHSTQSKIKKGILQSLLCVLSILPFLINQTNQISLLGIVASFFIGVLFEKYLLPFIFIMTVFPMKGYEFLFQGLDGFLVSISKVSLPIFVPSLSFIQILIYYCIGISILICLAKNQKKTSFLYLLLYFFCIFSLRYANIYYQVTFIDVGQGDSILIELPHNKGKVLIDSYGSNVSYLKSIGIRKLDYLVLTHFDYDHIGSVDEIISDFQVQMILYSAFENLEDLKGISVPMKAIQSGDFFKVDSLEFQVLGPIHKFDDANSNSVVLSFEIDGYRFLMTGDMTEKEEHDLLATYGNRLKADILKVAHHGSDTSSSEEFLNIVQPRYSIISVGKYNTYGLPSMDVVNRLKRISDVYLTKDSGNIQIKIRNGIKIVPFRKK